MNTDKLKQFVKLCECKNMTKAADALFISQSALSQNLQSIEEEFGHPLFTRHKKRLILNDQGVIALHYANRILNLMDEMRLSIANSCNVTRPLRITSDVYAMYPLLSVNFMLQQPEITTEFVSESSNSYAKMLLNKDCDIAITLYPLNDSEIECQFIQRDTPYVLVPENSEYYGHESVLPSNLEGRSFYRNRDLLTNTSIFAGGAMDTAVQQWNMVKIKTTYVDMDLMRLLWNTSTHYFFCSTLSIRVNSELRHLDRKRFVRFDVPEDKMRKFWISALTQHSENCATFLSWCLQSDALHDKFLNPFTP